MATRFYLPVGGAPPTLPAFTSSWESSVSAQRWPAVRAKSNTALTQYVKRFPSTTSQQMLFHQWISEPLNVDQSISGTVSMVVKTYEGNAAVDGYLAFVLKVMQGDSTTLVRGTLLQYHTTSTEKTTAWQTRIHSARAITTVNALAGDRIVIEIGSHGVTPSTSYDDGLKFGDPSATADYALTSGLTTDLCPWVELSATLTFGTPVTPQELEGSVAGTSSAAGSIRVSKAAAGAVSATSSAAGNLRVIHPQLLSGLAPAISAVVGAASAGKRLGGFAAGQSVIAGGILKPANASGAIPASSAASGTLSPAVAAHLAGIIAAQALAAGAAAVGKPLSGSIPAVSILAGDLLCSKLLSGAAPALSGVAGAAQQDVHLAGLAAAESLIVGDLSVGASAELAGIVAAASGVAATLLVEHFLAGIFPAGSALSGALEIGNPLAGEIRALSAAAGAIRVVQAVKLSGTVEATSAIAAALFSPIEVSGESTETVAMDVENAVSPAAATDSVVTMGVLGRSRV